MAISIHTWSEEAEPYVLWRLRGGHGALFVQMTEDGPEFTCDPEWAPVMTEAQARAEIARLPEAGDLVALPYNVAARIAALEDEIASFRGEIAGLQDVVKNASLPVDHTYEGDPVEDAKLSLEVETAEPHEGGGSCAYLTIDPKYVVVNKAWLEERLGE